MLYFCDFRYSVLVALVWLVGLHPFDLFVFFVEFGVDVALVLFK